MRPRVSSRRLTGFPFGSRSAPPAACLTTGSSYVPGFGGSYCYSSAAAATATQISQSNSATFPGVRGISVTDSDRGLGVLGDTTSPTGTGVLGFGNRAGTGVRGGWRAPRETDRHPTRAVAIGTAIVLPAYLALRAMRRRAA